MKFNSQNDQLNIKYPCNWKYKIIGTSIDDMFSAVEEILKEHKYSLTPSNISRNEKYYSLNISVFVPSEIIKNIIFQKFTEHGSIKYVI
jgi:putative lipoic acid-binding regulatory protein